MISIKSVTRKYKDATAEAKARKTAQLANELAEDRISRALVEQHNERIRQRRAEPYWSH